MLPASDVDAAGCFCPPAPDPPQTRLGPVKLLTTLQRNPLECWSAEFFREPIARVALPGIFKSRDPALCLSAFWRRASHLHWFFLRVAGSYDCPRHFVHRFEMQLLPDVRVWPVQRITLRSANGLRMQVVPRSGTRESRTGGELAEPVRPV